MSLSAIFNIIKATRPKTDLGLIEVGHKILQNQLKNYSGREKNNLLNEAIDKACQAARENADLDFITAALFFPIKNKEKNLLKQLRRQTNENIAKYVTAHDFMITALADEIHKPIVNHSYHTALLLTESSVDTDTIVAGMLHQIPHHTAYELKHIKKTFGSNVSDLLEKYYRIQNLTVTVGERYVQHLKEMVLSMSQDLRVITIKMCANIDRMKYLPNLEDEQIKNLAIESRDVLAPIADLLGMWRLRWQLEDLAFRVLEPEEYKKISRRFNVDEKKNREKYIQKTKQIVEKAMKEAGVEGHINGRFKHFYGIYNKMQRKNKRFNEVHDVFALRIIVRSVDECYRVMGIIHNIWKPKTGRIKDYIAIPKPNNYRSLHTTVFGLNGRLTEFQIRTKEMDHEAKFGIASHWKYKNQNTPNPKWIQEILDKQQQFKDDEEFLAHFSSAILNNRIFVFSPKGDVISLELDATPVDFAYAIHTELGDKCQGAIVNELAVPLNHKLKTNDVVEVIVDRQQPGPKAEWLGFVKSKKAKRKIESYLLKNQGA